MNTPNNYVFLETGLLERLQIGACMIFFLISLAGCSSSAPSDSHGYIYRIIDHLEKAEIRAKSFKIPVFQEVKMPIKGDTLKDGETDWEFFPFPETSSPTGDRGVIETEITFEDPIKIQKETLNEKMRLKYLRELIKSEKQFISVKPDQWKPLIGKWEFRDVIAVNRPIEQKKFFKNLEWTFKKLPFIPEKINFIEANIGPFQRVMTFVDIVFDENPLMQTLISPKREIKSDLMAFAGMGMCIEEPNASDPGNLNGHVILINKNSDLIFGRLINSKLVSPKRIIMPVPERTELLAAQIKKPGKKIAIRLYIRLENNFLDVLVGNYLFSSKVFENVKTNRGCRIGLVNAVREDTRFIDLKYKTFEGKVDKERVSKSREQAGVVLPRKPGDPPLIVGITSQGFLRLSEIGKPPLAAKQIFRENIGSPLTMQTVFSKGIYSIFIDGQREMVWQSGVEMGSFDALSFWRKKYDEFKAIPRDFILNNSSGSVVKISSKAGVVRTSSIVQINKIKMLGIGGDSSFDNQIEWDEIKSMRKVLLEMSQNERFKGNLLTGNVILDQTTCKSLITLAGSQLSFKVKIPKKAFLTFGAAVSPESYKTQKKVTFAVAVRSDGKDEEIFRKTIGGASSKGWDHFRVGLAAFAEKEVDLVFSTIGPENTFTFWGDPQVLSERDRDDINVILVSIDTLRADHLSSYGYARNTSPNIDAMGKRGVTFKNTIVQAPWTYPSHAAMLTSWYPTSLGYKFVADVHESPYAILPRKVTLLSEILQYNGYITAGFTGGGPIASEKGFSKGFHFYSEKWPKNIEIEYPLAEDWMRTHIKDKFFLFLHTFEVHEYNPDESGIYVDSIDPVNKYKRTIAAYDQKILKVDTYLGNLALFLESSGLKKNTLVIITSDHGEAFYEHEFKGHAFNLYDELLKVPLIFYMPRILPVGMVLDSQVSSLDIMPTILDMLGIPQGKDMMGKSLRNYFEGKDEKRIAFSEATSFFEFITKLNPTSVRTDRYKYLEYPPLDSELTQELQGGSFLRDQFSANSYEAHASPELYDLQANPEEHPTKILKNPELQRMFSNKIKEFKRKTAKKWASIRQDEDDSLTELPMREDTRKRLQALGYLQ